jgi:hypothetical protein
MRFRKSERVIISVLHLRRGFLESDGTVPTLAECLLINDVAPVEVLAYYILLFGIRVEHCRAVQLSDPRIRIVFIIVNALHACVGCSFPVALKVGVLA